MNSLQQELLNELPEFKAKTMAFVNKEISMKDYKGYSGGFGSYAQRGGNAFMLRLRMNQGRLTKEKLQFIVEQCRLHDVKRTHVTTCQTVQLHDVKAEALTSIMEKGLYHDIITRGGGGDFPRNVMCSPLSGVCKDEYFDVLPYAQKVGEYLLSIINKYSLPRKLKVAFSNTNTNETHANFRDLGFIANPDHTFDVYCCGGLGNNPMMGVKVGDHVDPKDILYYVNTMVLMFMEYGNYTNRAKARTRYMQETLGKERIAEEFNAKVSLAKKYLNHDIEIEEKVITKHGDKHDDLADRMIMQKQEGLYAVSYHPLGGNMAIDKWEELYNVIKDMDEVEIRLTPQGGMYIINLTYDEALTVIEHTNDGARNTFEASVSCIGATTCQVGLRDSNGVLVNLIKAIRPYNFKDGVLPRIYVSGCPSSCGTNQIGTIGLQGFTKLVDKTPQSAFKLSINGNPTRDNAIFGEEKGVILESDIVDFFVELGTMISQANMTFDTWTKENEEEFAKLLAKYC